MAIENKKAYGFLFQICTKTNKKELAIKPAPFFYSLRGRLSTTFNNLQKDLFVFQVVERFQTFVFCNFTKLVFDT